jgi:hypothetical protein
MEMAKTADEIDVEVFSRISEKITTADADSGWAVAYAAMRVLPVLKDVVAGLDTIRWVLGNDFIEPFTSPQIASQLRRIADLLQQRGNREEREGQGRR